MKYLSAKKEIFEKAFFPVTFINFRVNTQFIKGTGERRELVLLRGFDCEAKIARVYELAVTLSYRCH